MTELLWKSKSVVIESLKEIELSQKEYENIIFNNSEILKGIFLMKRQEGLKKKTIPDVIGIDQQGNFLIVEICNESVDELIISTALRHAFWLDVSPKSIKNFWLKFYDIPSNYNLNLNNYNTSIIIIAPYVFRSTFDMVDKIDYEVELLEVKKFKYKLNEFLFVNKLQKEILVPDPI